MRALQHVIVSRKRQACFERAQAFLFVAIEFTEEQIGIGHFEVIGREFALVLQEDIAIGEDRPIRRTRPYQIVDRVDALNVHGQTLETIGDLCRNGIALEAAHLLEVGELGHLHAVEPDFPS